MKRRLFKLLYWLSQWTVGIVQNIVGLIIFLIYIRKEHYMYHGAIVTLWKKRGSSLGMGMFIFISENCARDIRKNESREVTFDKTLVHEYGHTVQSAILGPLYLPVIGLPSVVWCSSSRLEKYRHVHEKSYYSLYPERFANFLGEYVTGNSSMGQALID